MGPLKENPTGYGGFHTLWAFLSHSNIHVRLHLLPQEDADDHEHAHDGDGEADIGDGVGLGC